MKPQTTPATASSQETGMRSCLARKPRRRRAAPSAGPSWVRTRCGCGGNSAVIDNLSGIPICGSERIMWPFVSEALKILGLTTPLLYGALIYGFFHYLDKRASGEAKRAISAWLETFRYDAGAVASAMMELFDKIYGIPLLARRAFLRSVLFTVGVTTAFLYESGELRTLVNLAGFTIIGRMAFASFLLINCLADYAALFLIRPMLGIGSDRPIAVLLAGIIAGATIVALNYVFWPSLTYFYMVTGLHPGIPRIDSYSWSELIDFI